MRTFLLIAVAGAGAWLALAAIGVPAAACAWLSGAAAAGALAWLSRPPRPPRAAGGGLALTALAVLGGLVTAAGLVPALRARARYAAAHRLIDQADDAAAGGATSVEVQPGRLVRPLLTTETEGGPRWPEPTS